MSDITYKFDFPTHHKSIIKVIGVGGGGNNAVNNMYKRGIKDVSFIVCNTDVQALKTSPIQNRLQIGAALTGGLGAGANPEVGRNAALESKDNIRELLSDDTKMLFITAGMGGGTGTGAAPVIASIARKQDILTVGIVTLPFSFEGKAKRLQAEAGIRELRKHCDTVLIIVNDKLQTTLGGLSISKAFLEADNVLTTAAKSIAEIITVPGYVNVDFEDVKTVMKNAGAAVMGSAEAAGEGRALQAAEKALASPLLDYTEIQGAKKILLSIVSGQDAELQMDELTVITNYIQEKTGNDAELIFGHGADADMAECIRVTVIATGFGQPQAEASQLNPLRGLSSEAFTKEPEGAALQAPGNPTSAPKSNAYKPSTHTQTSGDLHATLPHPQQLPLPFAAAHDTPHTLEAPYHTKRQKGKNVEPKNWEARLLKEHLEIPTYIRKQIALDPLDENGAAPDAKRHHLNLEESSDTQA